MTNFLAHVEDLNCDQRNAIADHHNLLNVLVHMDLMGKEYRAHLCKLVVRSLKELDRDDAIDNAIMAVLEEIDHACFKMDQEDIG